MRSIKLMILFGALLLSGGAYAGYLTLLGAGGAAPQVIIPSGFLLKVDAASKILLVNGVDRLQI